MRTGELSGGTRWPVTIHAARQTEPVHASPTDTEPLLLQYIMDNPITARAACVVSQLTDEFVNSSSPVDALRQTSVVLQEVPL